MPHPKRQLCCKQTNYKNGRLEIKNHKTNIYQTKKLKDVAWFQRSSETSLDFFKPNIIMKNNLIL
jgi:hypothetical protein